MPLSPHRSFFVGSILQKGGVNLDFKTVPQET